MAGIAGVAVFNTNTTLYMVNVQTFCTLKFLKKPTWSTFAILASVAQLDMHPTGDQEVAGSTPAGSETVFLGDLIMKYFLRSFSPFC